MRKVEQIFMGSENVVGPVGFRPGEAEPPLCCLISGLHLRALPQVMQQVSAAIQLLSRGQKSAGNCAQSSYSGWVTNWSRQHGGFGDLLSRLGITGQRYTNWSHNKLTRPPPPLHTHKKKNLSKPPYTHKLPVSRGEVVVVVAGEEQLVKGDFSCSVYFPLVNCVIAHGSGATTAQARPANEVTSFKLCAGGNKAAMQARKSPWIQTLLALQLFALLCLNFIQALFIFFK